MTVESEAIHAVYPQQIREAKELDFENGIVNEDLEAVILEPSLEAADVDDEDDADEKGRSLLNTFPFNINTNESQDHHDHLHHDHHEDDHHHHEHHEQHQTKEASPGKFPFNLPLRSPLSNRQSDQQPDIRDTPISINEIAASGSGSGRRCIDKVKYF